MLEHLVPLLVVLVWGVVEALWWWAMLEGVRLPGWALRFNHTPCLAKDLYFPDPLLHTPLQ